MSYKILHFSDLHLDTSFAGQGFSLDFGIERRLDLKSCLTRIAALAREKKVDAITIAGDLFDQNYLHPETVDFIEQQFAKLYPIKVIISPGESDPFTHNSPYEQVNWSENVEIFYQRKLTCIDLTSDLHIWGACNPPIKGQDLFEGFKPRKGNNILLLHCQRTIKNRDLHIVSEKDLIKAGFNLGLFGGEHFFEADYDDQSICLYPGTPEPLSSEEEKYAHNLIFIEIVDKEIKKQIIDFRRWHFKNLNIDISNFSSDNEIANTISSTAENIPKKFNNIILTVVLEGYPNYCLNLKSINSLIQSNYYYRLLTSFSLGIDITKLSEEQTVRGMLVKQFVDRIKKAQIEYEKNKEITALNFALQSLDGRQVGLYEINAN